MTIAGFPRKVSFVTEVAIVAVLFFPEGGFYWNLRIACCTAWVQAPVALSCRQS